MHLSLFLISALVSSLGTVVGFGGGIYIVPIMVMGFGVPIEIAIGVTALSLFPSSLLSTLWNVRRGNVDFKLMWALEIPTMLGAMGGAQLSSLIPGQPLEIVFSLFLVFLAWKMATVQKTKGTLGQMVDWLNAKKPLVRDARYHVSLWASTLFGGVSGVIAGLFGIGGGVLKTPIMIGVFKVPVRTATSTALCMIVLTSLTSGLFHLRLGHMRYDLLAPCAGGFVVGALGGNWLGLKMNDQAVKRILAGSLFLAGTATLVHSLWLS